MGDDLIPLEGSEKRHVANRVEVAGFTSNIRSPTIQTRSKQKDRKCKTQSTRKGVVYTVLDT